LSKKLLTLIMVLAFAAGAMAGDMNYTVYGKLHTSINYASNYYGDADTGEDLSQLGITSNTSRFGVKGGIAISDEYTAIWQFEQKLTIGGNATTATQELANRNSFLGVKAGWGSLIWGRHDTPFKTLGRKTTFFYDSIGDNRMAMGGIDDRTTGYLMYTSPDFNGINVRFGYEFDKNDAVTTEAGEAATSMSLMAYYAKDALFFGGAYESLSEGMTAGDESETRMRFAGKYTMDKIAFAASYSTVSDKGGMADLSTSSITAEAQFAATPKMNVKGGYYIYDPNTDTDDDGASFLTLGLDYNAAKNVQFYVQYAMTMNEDAAMNTLGGGWFGTSYTPEAAGENASCFSFGSVYKF
jgi:predicted porin